MTAGTALPAHGGRFTSRVESEFLNANDRDRADSRWTRALKTGESYEDEFAAAEGRRARASWFLARATADRDS